MRSIAGLSLGVTLLCATAVAHADTKSFASDVTDWAKGADYKLRVPDSCESRVETAFGGSSEACWRVKRRTKVDGLFPRLEILEARYADEQQAKERIKKLRKDPPGSQKHGEEEKTYPLRAGFRLKDRVIVITTDAFAFQPDVDRAASELAAQTGGTDVTCWDGCPAR
jgi:hypothetical protein